jgi:hypothetical protein
MAGLYETWILLLAPPWLLKPNAKKYLEAIGNLVDEEGVDRARESSRVGVVEVAPADALPALGRERQLERYAAESEDAYRTRLKEAFKTWGQAGTKAAVLASLNGGYPGPAWAVVENYEDDPEDSGFTEDFWSRFIVKMGNSALSPWKWGTAPTGSGFTWGQTNLTWGSTATPAQLALIKSLVLKFKPAFTVFDFIRITLSDASVILINVQDFIP